MTKSLLAIGLLGLLTGWATAQDTTNFPQLGKIHRFDEAVNELLPEDAMIEVLGSGFDWAEGPVWMKDAEAVNGGYLLFSDIPRNSVMKWEETIGISLFMKPSGYTGVADYGREPGCNGLAIDQKGRLISCEHGDRRISLLSKNGGKITLVDNYQGKRLNSPNDLALHSSGAMYFTDPPYGLPNRFDDPLRELEFCGVYRLSKDGELTLLTKEVPRPNGIAFSPDEKTLYIANSGSNPHWLSFPVNENGTLGEGKVFYDPGKEKKANPELKGGCDGLKVDREGNLFATGPGGVWIFTPDAKVLGRIETGERTANCGWGNDGSMLYITADMYLCRIQTLTKGNGF